MVKKPAEKKKPVHPAMAKLKALKKHWGAAVEQAGESAFDNLPEGQYVSRITGAELGESQSGRLQIHWEHTVVQGEEAGKKQHSYDGLDRPESLVWLARKLSRFGVEIDEIFDIENLPTVLSDIVDGDLLVKIQVKEKGDFTNTYVNKLLDADDFDDLVEPGEKKKAGKKKPAKDDDAGDDVGDDGEGEEVGYADIMEMDADGLDEIIDGNELKVKKGLGLLMKRKKVAEALELKPEPEGDDAGSGDDDDATATGDDDEPSKPTKGCKVLFLLKGKTKEGKVLKVSGNKLSVKVMPDGPTVEVKADECEVDDTPF